MLKRSLLALMVVMAAGGVLAQALPDGASPQPSPYGGAAVSAAFSAYSLLVPVGPALLAAAEVAPSSLAIGAVWPARNDDRLELMLASDATTVSLPYALADAAGPARSPEGWRLVKV